MKPTLLICDNFTSSLDMVMKERLLSIVSKELGKVLIGNMQNTIVVIPESVKIATSRRENACASAGCFCSCS